MKERLLKILNFITFGWLAKCPLKIEEPSFSLLTPTDDADDIEPYRCAMDFALLKKHKNVKNIAVAGPYGSGKSSFLGTYFKNKSNVLWVSLALFLENEAIKELKPGSLEFEHRLEVSILQQIFSWRKNTKWWMLRVCIVMALTVFGVVGVMQPDYLVDRVTREVHALVVDWSCWIFWFSAIVLSLIASFLLVKILDLIKSIGIKKIEVSGAGIGGLGFEVPESVTHSLLNHNIKALIKFFAKSKYNIVIFEDIDRFEDIRIFTKLREVNLLLNNSPHISGRRKPIRFIYALREDIFGDETKKTKFFDFVIPIIPRINVSNSRTDLMEFFEKCEERDVVEGVEQMVKEVSPYISDTRLLKNICNEYYIYHEQIGNCTSETELLGLVVFKNFFPREFALMHQGKGLIRKLLDIKAKAQKNQIKVIDEQIRGRTEGINSIKGEKIEDVERLRLLYYVALMRRFGRDNSRVFVEGSWVDPTDIIHMPNWFELLKQGGFHTNNYGGRAIEWKKIEDEVDPKCSYEEHLKRIEGRAKGRIEVEKREVQALRIEREQVRRKTIVDLMSDGALSDETIKAIVPKKNDDDGQDAELFLTLVKNGYLNENYHYNISIFREVAGVNSAEDYYFELGVMRGESADWERVLKRPRAVVENLGLKYFSAPAIMNFSVCTELLKTATAVKTKEFLRQIAGRNRVHYEFVNAYLKTLQCKDDEHYFFECLMAANENYIAELVETSFGGEGWPRGFVERQIGLFVAWALRQGRIVAITPFVKTFIEETARMPDLLKENGVCTAEEMSAFVKMFGLRFKRLDCKMAKDTGLLDVVIAERAYAIESDIIKGVLAGDGVDVAGFETKNYSVISKHKPVVACVDAEFKHYLDAVYLKCEAQQEDDLERVLNVINREELSAEDKQKFIHHQWRKSRVDDVKKIKSNEMVRFCIDEDWLVSSWGNAGEVWNRFKDDRGPFRTYVNRESCFKELSKENSSPFPWDKNVGWIKSLVEDEGLSDEAIGGLLSGMPAGTLTTYSGENATPTRIEILVRSGRIKFTNDLYRALKSHGNDSHIMLATMCAKEFCGAYVDGLANEEDAKKILTSNQLNRKYVVRVINTLKDLIVGSGDLIDEVVGFINKENYTEFDEGVLDAALDSITPVSLQCRIIQHLGGDADEIRRQLGRLEEPYKKLAGLGCRQQISRWDGVEGFLNFLKEKGIVSSTSDESGGKIQVNTTRS